MRRLYGLPRLVGSRNAPILRRPWARAGGDSQMRSAVIDVVGIGNAIVDVIAHADERFIAAQGLAPGAMTLIDAERADSLYRAMGVRFDTPAATVGPGTARCLILVTPDAQRTMATYLGACVELGPDDIDPALIAGARITYLEGYLFDPPQAQEAFRAAAVIAHGAGHQVALSLSDPFCVGRHRAAFRELVAGEVDILFANEAEICSLYETDDFAAAAASVRGHVAVAALTRSAEGSVVLADGMEYSVAAVPVARVVDTTGAGDLYAAGFLYGLTQGLPLPKCGAIGSLCAAEIISHVGARPETALSGLVKAAGLV